MLRPNGGKRSTAVLAATLAIMAGPVGVGCNSTPTASQQRQPPPPQRSPQAGGNGVSLAANQANPPKPDEMQQMLTRLQALELDNQDLKRRLSEQYHEAIELRRAQMEAQQRQAAGSPTTNGAPPPNAQPGGSPQASQQTPARGLDDYSRLELLDALISQIVGGADPARVKALTVAALSVASARHDLDHRLLDELDPRTREQVARFHQMVAVIFDEMAGDSTRTLTRTEMIEKIDEVFGQQPLSIEALELCRRVDSYGVYEPFPSTRFLAGRKNRVLVYIELENFYHHQTEDGQYEVKLEQSVELYDATGETTVWRQGPVELIDLSRRQRRDFFIVFPVDLPERLTAGGYRMKVRIADKHTGSICEQTLHNIEIVADQSMVGGGR